MDVKKRIREFIGKFISSDNITDGDNIFEQGIVHSLFAMQLVQFIEREFDIAVDNDELDLDNFRSIESIADFISSKKIGA